MKARQMMDKNFVYASKDETVAEISIKMENAKRFTVPILDNNTKLIGWVTSLDITKGLRENKNLVSEVMHDVEEILSINENEPARLAVIATSIHKLVSIPVINDEGQVSGVIRSFDIVDTLSDLYDIKVSKIYEAMEDELKGINWGELMEASAIVSRRTTGDKITAEEYEHKIEKTTFGEAIWATGGLEKFFAGLISVGELVIARKVGRARK